jgi:alkylation response protein AidB-like acyl-CoA dehydrogenase
MHRSEARWIHEARHVARDVLQPRAAQQEATQSFCREGLEALAQRGLLGMAIPRAWGGLELHPATQTCIFEELARGCATTAFVVSQHHVVTALLASSPNEALKAKWLPPLASGKVLGADGINFLRQGRIPPAVQASARVGPAVPSSPLSDAVSCQGQAERDTRPPQAEEGWVLDGTLPWVTAARHCQLLVCGGILADGAQLIVALPASGERSATSRLEVGEPHRLLALGGSETSSIHLQQVHVRPEQLVLGPAPDVLACAPRRGTTYVPTFMALGHARACLETCQPWAASRGAEGVALLCELQAALEALRQRALEAVAADDGQAAPGLRAAANRLTQQAAQACLTLGGGHGFACGAVPERLYREAAFWLVWSVGGAILPATLRALRPSQPPLA